MNSQDINKMKEAYLAVVSEAKFDAKVIKQAIGIASDKRYAGGNYSGAVKTIEKLAKGLSQHPQVAAVLKRQNEDIDPELLKKAAVGKKKSDDEEESGKKAVPAGKDVDVEKDEDEDEGEEKDSGEESEDKPKKKKKKDDEKTELEKDVEKDDVKEDASNDEEDDGEGLDKADPKAAKKKFKDRKDKDIDNDGDVDSSDKFLHKRRKAIGKAMKKESFKESSDALISELMGLLENKAPGEEHGETQSPQEKAFAELHAKSDKKIEDSYEDAVKVTTAAGKGGPSPKKLPGDTGQGDAAPKPVKEHSDLIQRTLEQLRKS
jgi:hypothetical protein